MSGQQAQELIKKYLSEADIMQMATVIGDQPWICTLHFVADDDCNIFWLSKLDRRHSQEIVVNSRVAIAVAIKTDKPLVGIQAEGTAKVVKDADVLRAAMAKYIKRHGTDESFANQIIADTNEHKLYMFTPKRYSLFDQVNFPNNPSTEWVINSK